MPYQSFQKTSIEGVIKVQPKVFGDERGWYSPTLEVLELEQNLGQKFNIVQIASSYNSKPGVLRGLHYQLAPQAQGKLVMATRGSVIDVALDIRKESPTFGQHVAVKLSAKDQNQLWLPPGCAHGYIALEPDTVFSYIVTDGRYSPELERGINPLDKSLNIDWQMDPSTIELNDRDRNRPNLDEIPQNELL